MIEEKELTVFEKALRIMQCIANNASEGREYEKHWEWITEQKDLMT